MTDPSATPARRLRDAIEPFHGFCYFTNETKTRYVELGLHPWASYFGQRAAAMGPVGPEVVTAVFYGFSPRLVERSIPSVWESLSPEEAWSDRIAAVGRVLQRLRGPIPDGDEVGRAIETGEAMVAAFVGGGRPVGNAHAAMDRPERPLERLWTVTTALREYRGDGHVAALVAGGVGPIESMVTAGRFSNLSVRFHQRSRGWSEDEWTAGVRRAIDSGWLDESGDVTPAGVDVRRAVEAGTDDAMADVIGAVPASDLESFIALVHRLSEVVIEAGEFRR